ncbi:hypothetical protein QYE76_037807 [Lolium multiflorum]|uniref:non-specific serine/threonine protein kinase n=1 Tax=Lolium multiflorum TaxID=4521 RepID=A0AAD8QHY3_LOLMU|nr:hypothetical protein QYE76_037807 [Lolium multiflorum]
MDMYRKIYKAELKWPKILENPWFKTSLDSELINYSIQTEDVVPVDMDPVFDPFSSSTTEATRAEENLTNLNAFDTISLLSGFDLSGMFEDNFNKESKFTSTSIAAASNHHKARGHCKELATKAHEEIWWIVTMESLQPGRKGVMSINTEILRIAPNYHLVEIKKTNGSFAKVYYGRNLKTSQSVAIKVIDKEKIFKCGLMDQVRREISVMKLVKHPNIVQLYEVMSTKTKI